MSDFTLNLYEVLGVESECSRSDIKNAYRRLVKKHHPDRGGDPELFELITKGFNILIDPQARAEYDEMSKLVDQSNADHFKLKQSAEEFIQAQESTKSNQSEKDVEKDFGRISDELDRKHNFKKSEIKIALNSDETAQRLADRRTIIEQENIEDAPDRLFDEGEKFNNNKFQAAFMKMHKKQNEMTVHTGNPLAYDSGVGAGVSFTSLSNIDKIYDEDENSAGVINSLFGPSHPVFDKPLRSKVSKVNIHDLSDDEDVVDHNYKDKNYTMSIEQKMRERDLETHNLAQRSMKDFDSDPTMAGYGILQPAGISGKEISWDDDKADMKKKYDRLLELRRNPK